MKKSIFSFLFISLASGFSVISQAGEAINNKNYAATCYDHGVQTFQDYSVIIKSLYIETNYYILKDSKGREVRVHGNCVLIENTPETFKLAPLSK